MQRGAGLGYSVAMDGAYTVAGAPFDDTGGQDSGVVKVFDSTTGALLFTLSNPTPAIDFFGYSVAISGSRVVVGTHGDDTGAEDAGSAYVYDLASGTPSVPVATLNNPSPAFGDHFGNSVAISDNWVVVGAVYDNTGATDAGSTYVYDLTSETPAVPFATLSNPAPSLNDYFGYAVGISGARVVVGAPWNGAAAGSVYEYVLNSGTPSVPVVTLNNPHATAGDIFGISVAISGSRVVVGVSGDDTGASQAGSAYVYDLGNIAPTVPLVMLNNPSPAELNHFGRTVAVSGTRVMIGEGGFNPGGAYAYDLNSKTPTVPVVTLNNPGPDADSSFGTSVAISGMQMVVGVPADDTASFDTGSVYLYDLANGTATVPVAKVNHPGPAAEDYFGASVAVSGTRVVVGVPYDDSGVFDAGSVYVYDLTSGVPAVPVFTLHNPNPGGGDWFGNSVAISGTRVVVGAPGDDTAAFSAGSVYVYDLARVTPAVPVVTLNNPGPAANDGFGSSVAISGTRVVVGANADDTGATEAGSAYVYNLNGGTPTVPFVTINNPGPAVRDFFGYKVAISGTRVAVGAHGDDTGATDAGSVYVYDVASGTPTVPVITLSNPGPAMGDGFGGAVAISGIRLVVGAAGDSTGAPYAGSAYVYDLTSGTPAVPVAILNDPNPMMYDNFGKSAAISGTRLVVGASGDVTGASEAGRAYIYDLSSSTPAVPVAALNNPGPAAQDNFASSVAIDGTIAVIGTPNDDSIILDKGFAYIFGPHPLDQDSDGLRDAWERTYWRGTTGHAPMDDFDHDGYNELLELALGLNPTVSNAGGLPVVINQGSYLTMTITKQPGVTYEVQSAGSLSPALSDSFSTASTTVLVNDATTLKVRDNTLIGKVPDRFLRLKVTAVP